MIYKIKHRGQPVEDIEVLNKQLLMQSLSEFGFERDLNKFLKLLCESIVNNRSPWFGYMDDWGVKITVLYKFPSFDENEYELCSDRANYKIYCNKTHVFNAEILKSQGSDAAIANYCKFYEAEKTVDGFFQYVALDILSGCVTIEEFLESDIKIEKIRDFDYYQVEDVRVEKL